MKYIHTTFWKTAKLLSFFFSDIDVHHFKLLGCSNTNHIILLADDFNIIITQLEQNKLTLIRRFSVQPEQPIPFSNFQICGNWIFCLKETGIVYIWGFDGMQKGVVDCIKYWKVKGVILQNTADVNPDNLLAPVPKDGFRFIHLSISVDLQTILIGDQDGRILSIDLDQYFSRFPFQSKIGLRFVEFKYMGSGAQQRSGSLSANAIKANKAQTNHHPSDIIGPHWYEENEAMYLNISQEPQWRPKTNFSYKLNGFSVQSTKKQNQGKVPISFCIETHIIIFVCACFKMYFSKPSIQYATNR